MMGTVRPHDVVLAYLQDKQRGTQQELLIGINSLCKALVGRGVYSAIDFTFYKYQVKSDIIQDILWEFTYSGLIDEVDGVYTMTKYGNKIVGRLLGSFKQSKEGIIYEDVRGSASKAKEND